MQRQRHTRRTLLRAFAAVGAGLVGWPLTARAAPEDAARVVSELAGQTITLISDSEMSRTERAERLQILIGRGFDTESIGRFVLGRHWQAADETQRAKFIELFRSYTALSYARRFEAYSGQRLAVTGSRDISTKDSTRALVHTQLSDKDGAPVKVDWRLRHGDDGWRIYDVIVENVSMVLTQKSEFAAVIERSGGNLQPLLDQLRERMKKMA
ncbi:MAG: ABC transporter substrate-binding protein [Alphaproteobacteria bacterium]